MMISRVNFKIIILSIICIEAVNGIDITLKNNSIRLLISLKNIGDLSLLNTSYYNLYNKVLEGYNPNIIPIRNPNNSLLINFDLSLIQIIAMVIRYYCT
jgi:hypothetical protein